MARKLAIVVSVLSILGIIHPGWADNSVKATKYVGSFFLAGQRCDAQLSYGGACFVIPASATHVGVSVADTFHEVTSGVVTFLNPTDRPGERVEAPLCNGTFSGAIPEEMEYVEISVQPSDGNLLVPNCGSATLGGLAGLIEVSFSS